MDMIAWDSNDDNLAEIHTRNIANSVALKDSMLLVNTNYSVGIAPSVINPGITASDQASFWNVGIGAILLIENYYGDFNLYYHTSSDLIDYYNFPYYDKCSKVCIGTLGLLAKVDGIVPVELASFSGSYDGNNINLSWQTATELNNYGFGIEKRTGSSEWYEIGFIQGNGTSQVPANYTFTDSKINNSGNYYYRLKQIDNDGSYKYSPVVEINVNSASEFTLEQNYPNPFNPSTKIRFGIPQSSYVRIAVYNLVGEEVAVLLNGNIESGTHEINFNASGLSSGVYFCRIQFEGASRMIKMMLLE
jgi:hypothetical protein